MDKIFKNIELKGAYKEAHEEAVKLFDLSEEEARDMESVAGLVQTIGMLEKLPLEKELGIAKAELEKVTKEARELKAKVNALEEANKKLEIENNNLLGSLKALKEVSIADDKIEATTLEYKPHLDPTFISFINEVNKNRNGR